MEECVAESLSREEILKILEQRRIQLDGMYIMPHAELVRVYSAFAMPLAQRQPRHHSHRHRCNGNNSRQDDEPMPVDSNGYAKMDIDIICTEKIEKVPKAEKRRTHQEALIDDYQYLSRATKRIKICVSPELHIP
ncbi:uncharacterized protein LOC105262015 [Musca domestica]|uniref:Uncharacterized protein LOC105262015 n=1 Tax=Musca domestica TaxID=7370 RepID=A0A9J7I9N9_MUSDO|nr:uncharacterized protein LOC105262015 [Musca domestica]